MYSTKIDIEKAKATCEMGTESYGRYGEDSNAEKQPVGIGETKGKIGNSNSLRRSKIDLYYEGKT